MHQRGRVAVSRFSRTHPPAFHFPFQAQSPEAEDALEIGVVSIEGRMPDKHRRYLFGFVFLCGALDPLANQHLFCREGQTQDAVAAAVRSNRMRPIADKPSVPRVQSLPRVAQFACAELRNRRANKITRRGGPVRPCRVRVPARPRVQPVDRREVARLRWGAVRARGGGDSHLSVVRAAAVSSRLAKRTSACSSRGRFAAYCRNESTHIMQQSDSALASGGTLR